MIVADISPFKGSTMCIVLTGGGLREDMRIYVHRDIIFDELLSKGAEISEEDADRLIYKNDLRRARERALYLLDGRDYSYGGLYDKLAENYPDEICGEVCDRLAKSGLINDRRYAERLCRYLFETKRFGEYRVRREMRAKGLTDEIISGAIEEFSEEDDVISRLTEIIEKKYERYLTDRKGVNKVKNALARLGYSYDDINEALENFDTDGDDEYE